MYVAHLAGFQPRDPLHIARTIELTNILEDVRFAVASLASLASLCSLKSPLDKL